MLKFLNESDATSAQRNRLLSIEDGDGDTSSDAGGGTAVSDGGHADGGKTGGDGTDGGSDTSNKDGFSAADRARFKDIPDEYLDAATAPYRELKKQYDPLATRINEMEEANKKLELQIQNQSQPGRDERTGPSQSEVALKGRVKKLMDKLSTIPANDTDRTAKIYTELVQLQEEIAEEKYYRLKGQDKQQDDAKGSAEKEAVAQLKKQGLDESYLEDVYREIDHLEIRNPNWFKTTPASKQIEELVKLTVARVTRIRDSAKAVTDANAANKKVAAGVLDEGSRHVNTGSKDDKDDEPDSFMAQLRNLKKNRVRDGNRMFQQVGSRPR